jgi:hypothetical protein
MRKVLTVIDGDAVASGLDQLLNPLDLLGCDANASSNLKALRSPAKRTVKVRMLRQVVIIGK